MNTRNLKVLIKNKLKCLKRNEFNNLDENEAIKIAWESLNLKSEIKGREYQKAYNWKTEILISLLEKKILVTDSSLLRT